MFSLSRVTHWRCCREQGLRVWCSAVVRPWLAFKQLLGGTEGGLVAKEREHELSAAWYSIRCSLRGVIKQPRKPSVMGSARPAGVHRVFPSVMPLLVDAGSKWCMALGVCTLTMLLLVLKNKGMKAQFAQDDWSPGGTALRSSGNCWGVLGTITV